MMTPLLVAGSAILCISAVIAFALTRRYGARFALMMLVLGLITGVGIIWQAEATSPQEGLRLALWTLVTSSPILLGTVIGILLARRPRD